MPLHIRLNVYEASSSKLISHSAQPNFSGSTHSDLSQLPNTSSYYFHDFKRGGWGGQKSGTRVKKAFVFLLMMRKKEIWLNTDRKYFPKTEDVEETIRRGISKTEKS